MKKSSQEVKKAVLHFAEKLNSTSNYLAMINIAKMSLPRLVESIVYDLFLAKFNPYFADIEDYIEYQNLLEYSTELKSNGFVEYAT